MIKSPFFFVGRVVVFHGTRLSFLSFTGTPVSPSGHQTSWGDVLFTTDETVRQGPGDSMVSS